MGYALEGGVTDAEGHSIVAFDGGTSSENTTSVALGSGGVFLGTGVDTSRWGSLIVTCHVDQASATDGLEVQWSPDNSTWFTSDSYTIVANACKIFTFMPVGKYYRIKYTNGVTPQVAFYLCSQWRSVSVKPSSHRIQDSITDEDDAELTKSVLTARQANGSFDNVGMDFTGSLNVAFGDLANLDAFSRLRVSNPDTVFDAGFQYDLQPLIFQAVTANGGSVTHLPNESSASLALDGTASGSSIFQSKIYHRYVPGKAQLVYMTGAFGTKVAGVKKRAGYFDANDGIFFEQNGTTDVAWTVRTSTSGSPSDASRVAQSSWNIDKLDGTGISGVTLDSTKSIILVIQFQWLGHGRVLVGFDVGGRIYPVHQFNHANVTSTVYMKTPNLPNRYEITGDTEASMIATCMSVQSEGGADKFLGYNFAYNRAVVTAGNGTPVLAFNIRPKATFNSITNRMSIKPTEFSCLVGGANPVLLEVYFGTTVGGSPSWADMDATFSALQVDTAGTPSGGIKVASFYNPAGAQFKTTQSKDFSTRYPLVLDVAGTGYTNMTVYVTGYTGTSTCYAGMQWEEVR